MGGDGDATYSHTYPVYDGSGLDTYWRRTGTVVVSCAPPWTGITIDALDGVENVVAGDGHGSCDSAPRCIVVPSRRAGIIFVSPSFMEQIADKKLTDE